MGINTPPPPPPRLLCPTQIPPFYIVVDRIHRNMRFKSYDIVPEAAKVLDEGSMPRPYMLRASVF